MPTPSRFAASVIAAKTTAELRIPQPRASGEHPRPSGAWTGHLASIYRRLSRQRECCRNRESATRVTTLAIGCGGEHARGMPRLENRETWRTQREIAEVARLAACHVSKTARRGMPRALPPPQSHAGCATSRGFRDVACRERVHLRNLWPVL